MSCQTITAADFLRLENPLAIDVRGALEVEAERWQHSVNLPLSTLTLDKVGACLSTHKARKNEPIYLICKSGVRSERACAQLAGKISNPLWVIGGGVDALRQAGAEIIGKPTPKLSVEQQARLTTGSLILLSVLIGTAVHPMGFSLAAVVGVGLLLAGATNSCALVVALAKMPWNKPSRS